MVERRHSLESPFYVGFNDTPLVGVRSFRRFIRNLEYDGFVDSNIDAVIDVVVLLVASNLLLLRSLFLRDEWEVSLAWNDGLEWDPVADIVLELVCGIVVNSVGGLGNGMGATHFGRFVLFGGRASIVEGSVAALEAFLVGEDEVKRDDGGLLLRSQGLWRAWNAGWSGLGALVGDLNCMLGEVLGIAV
jgi:hypothetical protein